MPNDENSGITEEQRARISRNFKAASAILSRKRPRLHRHDVCSSGSIDYSSYSLPHSRRVMDSDGGGNENHTSVSKRVPLKEIPCNITPAVSEDRLNAYALDYCETPITLIESSALSNSSPSILDVDFDESVLEEIDALCEPKSHTKFGRQDLCPNIHAEVSHNSCNSADGVGVSINSVIEDASMQSVGKLDFVEDMQSREDKTNLLTVHMKNMPQDYSKYLLSLNERQQEAACCDISVPLVIVAGPGSGKTSTMVGRVLMLLSEGICPSNILAMTFTTAAASEMRERIGTVAGKELAKELTISTFHSFSLHLCRSHAEKLERTSEFLIYGHGQQRRAIIEAVRLFEHGKSQQKLDAHLPGEVSNNVVSPEFYKDRSKKWLKFVTKAQLKKCLWLSRVSVYTAKASGKTPTDCRQMGDEIGAVILDNYNDILKSCNALDYHDLISCSVKLLTDYPEVFNECKDSWKAILVDEFQDTSSMQYNLLQLLSSHNCVTIVGDDDQSIFSFNGADVSGFYSFKVDFPNYKEVRLHKNYRSTRHIVEAASSLINNNTKRCQLKVVQTDNSFGSKITIKESHNEESQCAFVVDKILEVASNAATPKCFGKMAILYRRQVSGKIFQTALRNRKIPFNLHGVAFYRKKVVRAIVAMLKTTVSGCDEGQYHRVFKALLPFEKEEKKRIINHIEKVSAIRQCNFMEAACDIFNAKISGTLKRNQLTQGRKVLSTIEMISKLVQREQSISAVITSVSNMVPQRYLLEQKAVVNVDGGKLLNEDNDVRSVLQYLLDDVSEFYSSYYTVADGEKESFANENGCQHVLKAFIDYISDRERENFQSRRRDNQNSISLTTIHQSKGLEWDVVFIVKANEYEIPLLREFDALAEENGTSVEEERRLFYVAMTRAREKLYILYIVMDSNWQILQPSRFLREIPSHVCEIQGELAIQSFQRKDHHMHGENSECDITLHKKLHSSEVEMPQNDSLIQIDENSEELKEPMETRNQNKFLRRFNAENRSIISLLFHQWAKKQAFQDPTRLLDKVGFVIDERLRVKKTKNKEVLCSVKASLKSEEAFQYAEQVLRWEQMPADRRSLLMQEKQEHFQKSRIESAMGSSMATSKQISYLQNLGCTITPTSRLHASRLIEQYKSL